MGDSLENPDSSVETQNVQIVDYGEFANYIRKAATILLPEEDATAPALNVALEDKNNQDCIKKFLSDPQIPALYVQRNSSKGKRIHLFFLFGVRYKKKERKKKSRRRISFELLVAADGVLYVHD